MPERGEMEFSNPMAPPDIIEDEDEDDRHPLTNADFRKMMMTPRVPSSSSSKSFTERSQSSSSTIIEEEDDPATRRKKKKLYYAKLKRLEEERQKELAEKYRDRAKERRTGGDDYDQGETVSTTADYRAVAPDAKSIENYAERRKQVIQESKYLGGDMEHTHLVKGLDYALLEKVRAEISSKEREEEQEMEKVVTQTKDKKEEQDPEQQMQVPLNDSRVPDRGGDLSITCKISKINRQQSFRLVLRGDADSIFKLFKFTGRNELFLPGRMAYVVDLEDEFADSDIPNTVIRSKADCPSLEFKTKIGRNIYRTLFKPKDTGRNELFLPGRMAYVVDLEDEFADSDIPNTVIRSKADCPSLEATTTLTTNDIVINKLTQILSYLRQGRRESKKLKKLKEKGKLKEADKLLAKLPGADDSIFGDVGDYIPAIQKKDKKDKRDRDDRDRRDRDRDYDRNRDHRDRRDRDRDRRDRDKSRYDDKSGKRKSYFEKPMEEDEDSSRTGSVKELVKSVNDRYRGYAEMEDEKERKAQKKEEERIKKLKQKTEIDSYAECYPGMEEAADAIDDSDEEVDYTKMDQGNKKGPIGRWDFDTQEEYSDYMSNKEALPKAAFQYGVKMSDGRKTRRAGPKDEKAVLDRQWQQIQNIMNKRKAMGESGGMDDSKKAKY